MKNRLMQPIKIQLQASLLLLGALLCVSMLACMSVIILAIPFTLKLCLLAAIILSTVYYTLRDALQQFPWSWQLVEVTSLGQLRLTNQRGEQFMPKLDASSYIHPLLVILNAKSARALPAVLLFSQADCEQHRRLRVWLRWWQHEQ